MRFRHFALAASLFTAVALLTAPGRAAPPTPAQKKGGPQANAFRVQVRHPGWRRFLVTTNPAAAQLQVLQLRRTGWGAVQVRRPKPGVYVVRAKIARWKDRAVVTNRAVADSLAGVGRRQGFQARVVPFHRN